MTLDRVVPTPGLAGSKRHPPADRWERPLIARIWRGTVRTARAAEYVDYILGTGMAEYRRTPGNRGAQMLTRDLGDGRTEVITMSWWVSLDSVRGFAGDDISAAVFYPADDDFLLDRDETVRHYEVRD